MIPDGWTTEARSLPPLPGAYLLRIVLAAPAALPPGFGGRLAPGCYLYAGSARGPGGIRARAARHLRPDKSRRWHVDWLTGGAADVTARARPDVHECDLVAELLGAGASVPLPRFGSSDCRRCPSHLLACPHHPA